MTCATGAGQPGDSGGGIAGLVGSISLVFVETDESHPPTGNRAARPQAQQPAALRNALPLRRRGIAADEIDIVVDSV